MPRIYPEKSTYLTTKPIHDVAWCNINNLNNFKSSKVGGLIVQIGQVKASTNEIAWVERFRQYVARYKGKIPLGFYVYSYIPFNTPETVTKQRFQNCVDALSREGLSPQDVQLGIWLDLEWDGPASVDPDTNFKQVRWFREVFAAAGYPLVGLYSAPGYMTSYFNLSDCATVPLWLAAWAGDGTSYASGPSELPNYVSPSIYDVIKDQIYIWQDGGESYPAGLVDHDWQIKAIPYVTYKESDTPSETDQPVPEYGPNRGRPVIIKQPTIKFTPEPGRILKADTVLGITCSDEDAIISITLDNSVPSYVSKSASQKALREYRVLPATRPGQNIYVRAWAFDPDTHEPVAVGSACYAWVWTRPVAGTSDLDVQLGPNIYPELIMDPLSD